MVGGGVVFYFLYIVKKSIQNLQPIDLMFDDGFLRLDLH